MDQKYTLYEGSSFEELTILFRHTFLLNQFFFKERYPFATLARDAKLKMGLSELSSANLNEITALSYLFSSYKICPRL